MDAFSTIINAFRRERNAYVRRAYYAVRDEDEPLGPKGQAAMRQIEDKYATMMRDAYPETGEEVWITVASLAVAICQTYERENN